MRLEDTYNQLEGENHIKIIADLCKNENFELLANVLPLLNGIVHCAGISDPVPFQFINNDKLKNIFEINFFAPVLLSKEIIKRKLIKKDSSIVFISSISGTVCSYVAGSMYSATKGAINGVVKGMAIDLASKNIRVNTVQPGMIKTNILEHGKISEEQLIEDVKRYPLKRYGNPEEVAYAVIYLLSDASSWITGSNLLIDGGYTLL
jgi:NAD(P)-dependent dehydrogenase (short-subunit alcohol dehydrogenase family)